MSTEEYWIGYGVDFRGVWDDFESGQPYISKYETMQVHLMRFTFEQYPSNLPLFNHEAIYKTIKGYFHELKWTCMTEQEYAEAGPLFLYDIDRGSGIWSFLGELRQLLLLGMTLADEKVLGEELENMDRKLRIINRYFGNAARPEDFQQFMKAKTPRELEFAVRKLLEQRLKKIEISRTPFTSKGQAEANLIELKSLLGNPGSSRQ